MATGIGKLTLDVLLHALKGGVKWTADTIKMALLSTTATANWQYYSTVLHEFSTAGGYTNGGLTLTSCTVTATKANTFGASRAATTAYKVGQVVRPATGNGFVYRCSVAGTTAATLPTYPTVVGETVTDGTVRWTNAGESITVITSTAPAWTPVTLTGVKAAVIYDSTPGTAATDPVIAVINFTTSLSPNNGKLQVTPDAHVGFGWWTPA